MFVSDDGAKSWSCPRPIQLRGLDPLAKYPAHLLPLADGRILLTVGCRSVHGSRTHGTPGLPGQGCAAYLLDGELSNIEEAEPVSVIGDSLNLDCGYPWAAQRADGAIVVICYTTTPDYLRGIESAILRID